MLDLLGIGQLVNGLAGVADPYFYTQQEKEKDQLAATGLTNQANAIQANVAINAKKEETTQKAIQYGLVGVMGVSCVYLAAKFIGGK